MIHGGDRQALAFADAVDQRECPLRVVNRRPPFAEIRVRVAEQLERHREIGIEFHGTLKERNRLQRQASAIEVGSPRVRLKGVERGGRHRHDLVALERLDGGERFTQPRPHGRRGRTQRREHVLFVLRLHLLSGQRLAIFASRWHEG